MFNALFLIWPPASRSKVCRVWRYKAAPHLGKLIDDAQKMEECSRMWLGFDRAVLDCESPSSMFGLRQHLAGHMETCGAACPVSAYCIDMIEQLDKWQPLLNKFSWHWWHAHRLASEAAEMLSAPRPGTFYVCMDFQDRQVATTITGTAGKVVRRE